MWGGAAQPSACGVEQQVSKGEQTLKNPSGVGCLQTHERLSKDVCPATLSWGDPQSSHQEDRLGLMGFRRKQKAILCKVREHERSRIV